MSLLEIRNLSGFVICNSSHYEKVHATVDNFTGNFDEGIYIFNGEIDTGAWAVPSALVKHRKSNDVIIDSESKIYFDGKEVSLEYINKITYDLSNFSIHRYEKFSNVTVTDCIKKALKRSKSNYTFKDIIDIMALDKDRLDRPIIHTGNQKYRMKAAIGFSMGYKIFVFPWFSTRQMKNRIDDFKSLSETLASYGRIVFLPVSTVPKEFESMNILRF